MSDLVADRCIAAKWVISEGDSPRAIQVFQDTGRAGGRLILLDLALVEVTQVIWKRFHRGLISAAETETIFSDLQSLPCSIEPAARHLKRALEVARAYRRSVYDALFALCEDLGVIGVTSDEPRYQAVRVAFPNVRLLRDWNIQDPDGLP